MVSAKKLQGDCTFLRQNTGSEQLKCHLAGIKTNIFLFGTAANGNSNDIYGELALLAGNEQSLLDALLLAQWEEWTWRSQMIYDVTSCETKVISGKKKFIAQMNEKGNLNSLAEFEDKVFQPLGSFKSSFMKSHKEDILFCVANGEKETSEFILSGTLPKDGMLFIANANPVEYGHVFLVPYDIHNLPSYLNKRSFDLVTRIAVEMNNCSFRISFDHTVSGSHHLYFQGSYFARDLPVELLPTIPVYGDSRGKGLHISEVIDYPLKTLVFMSKDNLKLLTEVVAEVCSLLKDRNTVFNLLISEYGTKIFLFPQVHKSVDGRPLSAWECGGYFVYKTRSEFKSASEVELVKRLESIALNDMEFEALKQLCCEIANDQLP